MTKEYKELVVIASLSEGTENWGVSFSGRNPPDKDYISCASKEDAFRLSEIIRNVDFKALDKSKEESASGDAMAVLLAVQEYNHGNISIDQLAMVYESAGLIMLTAIRKSIEEFKQELDKKKDEQATG